MKAEMETVITLETATGEKIDLRSLHDSQLLVFYRNLLNDYEKNIENMEFKTFLCLVGEEVQKRRLINYM